MYYVETSDGGVRRATLQEFAELYDGQNGMAKRRVALTEFKGVTVSTVFLGLDHSFGGSRPILYETMVDGGAGWDCQRRHHTRAESQEWHDRVVCVLQDCINMGMDRDETIATIEELD